MDEIEKRFKREEASTRRVADHRAQLIAEGSFPAKFSFPLAMQFEVTSRCNLKCKHCYNRSGGNQPADAMTGDKWVAFAKKLVDKGGLFEATISGGEPLLLGDKLFEIMDILHDDGTVFNLVSNGYLFDRKILARMKKYRFYWIQISMDSSSAERHDEFRGVKGSWQRAAEAAYPVIGEVIPSGRAFDNEEIFLSRAELNRFYSTTDELIKRYKDKLSILVSSSPRLQFCYRQRSARRRGRNLC